MGCKISTEKFAKIVKQFGRDPTFCIDVIISGSDVSSTTLPPIPLCQNLTSLDLSTPSLLLCDSNSKIPSVLTIKSIPEVDCILNLQIHIQKLENKHRSTISNAVIQECFRVNKNKM